MRERVPLGGYLYEVSLRNKLNDTIPVYSVTNDAGFCKDYFGKEVASKDKSTYKIVPWGCFAYNPSRINVGSIACQKKEERVIVSPLYVIFGTKNIDEDFLLYFLKSNYAMQFINAYARGAVRNNFSFKKMAELTVPLYSPKEQEAIVSELDTVHSILDKKNEQLKELDALAQSIFYQMFGDPITNEKGWPISSLSKIAIGKLAYGSGASAVEFDGSLRYVRITDITENGELNGQPSSPSAFDGKYLLNDGDILFARTGATVGKTYCHNVKYGKCIYAGYLIRLVPNKEIVLPTYVFHFTKSAFYLDFVATAQRAVAQPNINAQQYGDLQIPLPPLTLQQEFAAKVEAIEAQKEAIKQSIREVEALLAQTMDKYFG